MISVLCPSRGNPELLARSVQSLRARAWAEPEILIAADADDAATCRKALELTGRVHISERAGYDRLHEYYQALAAVATGDWLLVWNDDAVMMTDGWDARIGELPPEAYVADLASPHSPLCCFPAVRREAVAALGKFSTANPHVDTFWGDIAMASGTLRRVDVYVSCDSPVRNNPHDFYQPHHQAEMARCAEILRRTLCP